ncbi:MAG: hypothetical protein RXR06_07945 [Thermoproteus sp.]
MFFNRRRKEQRKRRLLDVEVEREECFELGRGLDAFPDVKKALEGALPVGGALDEVCFRTLVGEDVPGGRAEVAAIRLFFANPVAVQRALEALEGLGIKASARNYGLYGAVWEIYLQLPNVRQD